MAGEIFLVQGDGELVELGEQPYEVEAVLQRLIADYPHLLAGHQMNPDSPRRWLVVSQEVALASGEDGAGRWSVDHLLIDQDAIPTIVEVKRSTDSRIRREVVGQMLDYAANAVLYWPVEQLRARFEARCQQRAGDPDSEIAALGGIPNDPDHFWQQVKANLQSGRLRLVFVADVIPPELQRIVEFLNGQMDPAEVLAVEIRQYTGQGVQALVPKVVGQTAAAQQAKSVGTASTKHQWDEPSFFDALGARRNPEEAEVARDLLAWARRRELRVWWGKGIKDGSFFPMVDKPFEWTISVWTYGRLEIQFQQFVNQGEDASRFFASREARQALRERLNAIPGVSIPADGITRRPSIPLTTLVDRAARSRFIDILDWMVEQIKAFSSRPPDV